MALIWLGSLPTFIYLLNSRRPPIPFFPLVGLFYASNFGLPLFGADGQFTSDDAQLRLGDVSAQCLWLTFGGMVCLLAAFYAGHIFFHRRFKPLRIPGNHLAPRFQGMLWVFMLVYFAYTYFPYLRLIPSLGTLLTAVGYLSFGMLFQLSLNGQLSLPKKLFLWLGCVPLELIYRLSSGSIAQTMIFAIFFSLVALRSAPKLALASFAFGVATLAIFNPVKGTFRAITWYISDTNTYSGPGLAYEKCVLLFHLAYEYHLGGAKRLPSLDEQQTTVSSLVGRLSSITVLALVVDRTPTVVPYWSGASYLPLFTKPIPRLLWPGKPIEDIGNEFGHRYFLLDDADEITSINLPWIVEMFANFGALGLLVGMGVIGFGLAYLDRIFNVLKSNPIEYVVGATLLLNLFYQESSFSLMAGQALLLYIALRIALKIALPPVVHASRPGIGAIMRRAGGSRK